MSNVSILDLSRTANGKRTRNRTLAVLYLTSSICANLCNWGWVTCYASGKKKGLKNELLRFFTLMALFSINFKCIFSNEMCLS